MILVFTAAPTNRIHYSVDLIFSQMLGVQCRITSSSEDFGNFPGPKIIYGDKSVPGAVFIRAYGFLAQTGISVFTPEVAARAGFPMLFPIDDASAALPFDIFSAVFYLLSRYEEYLPFESDRYGRFPATESLAYKSGFLEIPVVNHWVKMLSDVLMANFPGMKINKPAYQFVPTIDVDHAWCYLGRPLKRTSGGFARSFFNGRFSEITDRVRVLTGLMRDPYDNYGFIEDVHRDHPGKLKYFILNADYGGNDNNVTVTSGKFRRLLREIDQDRRVGIHPSLSSGRDPDKLTSEIIGLADILGRKIEISRQHFLKLSFPDTYRSLEHFGVMHDYSMGYASHPGFRAGIAVPFRFFDLPQDRITPLVIHPVTIMDVTFRDQLRLNPVDSLGKMAELIGKVREADGELVTIWHNESLGDYGRWKGWREVYKEIVKLASEVS